MFIGQWFHTDITFVIDNIITVALYTLCKAPYPFNIFSRYDISTIKEIATIKTVCMTDVF